MNWTPVEMPHANVVRAERRTNARGATEYRGLLRVPEGYLLVTGYGSQRAGIRLRFFGTPVETQRHDDLHAAVDDLLALRTTSMCAEYLNRMARHIDRDEWFVEAA